MSTGAIVDLVRGITPLIDELYTTPEERSEAKLRLLELAQKSELAQIQVNTEEAKSTSLFVSGWRPAVGWVCVSALAISFIILPLVATVAVYYSAYTGEHVDLSGLPELDWASLGPVLLGMLGLGTLRSFEKTKGVARS